MTRHLFCEACGVMKPMHPEDAAMGFARRRIEFQASKPKEHFILVDGERQDLSSLACDQCGKDIPDGSTVIAQTMWMTSREGTPGLWEEEYGYKP